MTLYAKHGRRYLPVADNEALHELHNGDWVVSIRDGRTSIRRLVDGVGKAAEVAAAVHLADAILPILREASRAALGRGSPLTAKERRAYAAYKAIAGDGAELWLTRPAIQDIAERIAKRLVEMAKQP